LESTFRFIPSKCQLLIAIENKSWGWSKTNMCKLYTPLQVFVLNYAALGWQPRLSKTNMEKLRIKLSRSLLSNTDTREGTHN